MVLVNTALIIGGGIGGLATALGLKRKGIDVEIVERMEQSQVYHVGIIVQGNFLHALGRLGLAEKAIAAGFPYDGFHNYDANGNFLFSQPPIYMGDGDFPAFLGLTRPALHEVQLDAVREEGIPLRLGVTYEKLEDLGDKVSVTFTDGSTKSYDIVIAADGVNSPTRKLLFGDKYEPAFTGQGVWRYNIPRPADLKDMMLFRAKPGGTAGLVPLTKNTMYLFYVGGESGNPYFPPETLAKELQDRIAVYKGPIESVRPHITDPKLVVYRPLFATLVREPWHRGRIVLLGDACHASTPHMGQGAALAVEDAVVLAEELTTAKDIDTALSNHFNRRFERCKQVVEGSMAIGAHELDPNDGLDVPALFGRVYQTLAQPLSPTAPARSSLVQEPV
ncbi:FAD-dependent monooxygenase [Bradyrhizobium sp. Leo121]|uniref:FAD-dependent monooxygenase n=1 Tax=Bradyrhizobium sp. Leo121 TaxID=1571195 RepID=UPI001029BAE8|nr:FAD-dependent monooxygenase [Bradyrhizobium sp. Leo121]RZN31443.1 2-polyprenyl-6-methoxyphenol hydroxylase [Bradyrhizobium sp. Leo121]